MNSRGALMRALPKHLQRQGAYSILRTMATRALGTTVASRVGQGTTTKKKNNGSSSRVCVSGVLSFASPESDFTAQRHADIAIAERAFSARPAPPLPGNKNFDGPSVWSGNLSFASPESDFTASDEGASARERAHRIAEKNSNHNVGFATPESTTSDSSSTSSPHVLSFLDERQRGQLADIERNFAAPHDDEVVVYDTRRELLDDHQADHAAADDQEEDDVEPQFHFEDVFARTDARPLPQTYAEATRWGDDRAIVVTEAAVPFKIVDVNVAWEGLCGYARNEAVGKSLGELLQGPETDKGAATALVDKLLHGMEAGAVLTNYAAGGRRFQNRIRVGPILDENDRVTHFVGVLKEITEMGEHFSDEQTRTTRMA